jgi:hypothetical protein
MLDIPKYAKRLKEIHAEIKPNACDGNATAMEAHLTELIIELEEMVVDFIENREPNETIRNSTIV